MTSRRPPFRWKGPEDTCSPLRMARTDPRVAAALRDHGLTDQELQRAHTLLQRAMGTTLPPPPPTFDRATLVRALDDWENLWLHVAEVVLSCRYRHLHAQVFLNLTRQSDTTVVVTVDTFLQRLAALEQRAAAEPEVAQALALLRTRGLTLARVATRARPPGRGNRRSTSGTGVG